MKGKSKTFRKIWSLILVFTMVLSLMAPSASVAAASDELTVNTEATADTLDASQSAEEEAAVGITLASLQILNQGEEKTKIENLSVTEQGLSQFGLADAAFASENTVTLLDAMIAYLQNTFADEMTADNFTDYMAFDENGKLITFAKEDVSEKNIVITDNQAAPLFAGTAPEDVMNSEMVTLDYLQAIVISDTDNVVINVCEKDKPQNPEVTVEESEEESTEESIVQEDAASQSITEEPILAAQAGEVTLKTTLTDNFQQKGSKKTFDVWARNGSDAKISSEAILYKDDETKEDGTAIAVNWDDTEKTSYTVDFTDKDNGAYCIYVRAFENGGGEKEAIYHLNYQKAEKGEFIGYLSFEIEAFTISCGYIVEPCLVPIYEGENAAQLMNRALEQNGYSLSYTGSLESGFYMSSIKQLPEDFLDNAKLDPKVATIDSIADSFDATDYTSGELGEFNFNFMSGWMYTMNNVFPNVGYADCYPGDGDVMRTQFTLGYGSEIGGGWGGAYYEVANKDQLVKIMAKVNSSVNAEELLKDTKIAAAMKDAAEVSKSIGSTQEEVNAAVKKINDALSGDQATLTLDPKEITLENGETAAIKAKVNSNTALANVEWNSSDLKIAKVDEKGKVTAVGAGEAIITATLGTLKETCKVTVKASPLTDITISETEKAIKKNEKFNLTVGYVPANTTDDKTLTWTSSDPEVASVSENGQVKGLKQGQTDITVTSKTGSFTKTCKVTVQEIHIESISIPSSLSLNKGKSTYLNVTYNPSDTTDDKNVTWTSADPAIAKVSTSGYVTAVSKGETVISAEIGEFKAECAVTINEYPITSIQISPMSTSIGVGKSKYLSKTILPSNTTDSTSVTWSSADTSIATVSNSGYLKGIKEGTTTITVKASNGMTDYALVNVVAAPVNTTAITISDEAAVLTIGEQKNLRAEVTPATSTDPVRWTSSDETVATVKDGVVTAVWGGTATITAASNNKKASCEISVNGALKELSFYQGSSATSVPYTMTEEFDRNKKEYTIYALDSLSQVGVKAAFADGYEGTITAKWKNTSGTDKSLAITSAKATPTALASLIAANVKGNEVTIEAKSGDSVEVYTIHFLRNTSLSALSAKSDTGRTLVMDPEFKNSTLEYSANILSNERNITFTPVGYNSNYDLTVNSASVGKDGTVTLKVPRFSKSATYTICAEGEDGVPLEYKVTLNKVEEAKITFDTNPEDTVVVLKDSKGNRMPKDGDTYSLLTGETYTYTATRLGYIAKTDSFTATESKSIKITLKKAADSTLTNLPSEWSDFRNSKDNMAITSTSTVSNPAEASMKWAVKLGAGWGGNATGAPILVNGYVISYSGTTLYKCSKEDGSIVATGTMAGSSAYSIIPPTYANGMIFIGLNGGKIQCFDAETMKSLWVYTDPLGGQPNSAIKYSDGYVYAGFWNSEVKDANFVCLTTTDEDPSQETEAKLASWNQTVAGGFYWAGAYATDKYVYVGTDDGQSGNTSPTASVCAYDKITGTVVDTMTGFIGDIRSDLAYDTASDRIYFTSKGGYMYSLKLNADGTFNKESLQSLELGGMSTSTPVVYKGRAYVGVSGVSQFGTGGHCVTVAAIAEDGSMNIAYRVDAKGYPQTSGMLSTATEEKDGYVSVYFTYNAQPGGILMIRDKAGLTEADAQTGEVFTPPVAQSQYCICSVICDADGTIYYKNDSSYLMAIEKKEAYLTGALADGGNGVIDAGNAFAGSESAHEITVDAGTAETTLTLTASEGSIITMNDIEGASQTITLTDGAAAVHVVVTNGTDSKEYDFSIRERKADAALSMLRVNASNSYASSLITLDPAFDPEVMDYTAAYGSAKSFLNVWAEAVDTNASVKLYPVGKVGENTELAEDGSIEITATNSNHNRYAVYFADGYDMAKVKVVVTAEDGTTAKEYTVTLCLPDSNAPVLSDPETTTRNSDTQATVVVTASKAAQLYYAIVDKDAEAPVITTDGEGTALMFGDNTMDVELTEGAKDIYMAAKDASGRISDTLKVQIPGYIGWVTIDGKNYYKIDSDGTLATGLLKINDETYYFDKEGVMQIGWQTVDSKKYYFSEDGIMQTGWQTLDGKKYYFAEDGVMQTGWQMIDGKKYYLAEAGNMKTGWQKISGKWYYLGTSKDGAMKYGWQKISGKWYYLSKNINDGSMKIGWQKIGSKWYYLSKTDKDGSMKTGWQKVGSKWYYLGSANDGSMKTGWQKVGGKYYYLHPTKSPVGHMAANEWIGRYYVNGSGVWTQTK